MSDISSSCAASDDFIPLSRPSSPTESIDEDWVVVTVPTNQPSEILSNMANNTREYEYVQMLGPGEAIEEEEQQHQQLKPSSQSTTTINPHASTSSRGTIIQQLPSVQNVERFLDHHRTLSVLSPFSSTSIQSNSKSASISIGGSQINKISLSTKLLPLPMTDYLRSILMNTLTYTKDEFSAPPNQERMMNFISSGEIYDHICPSSTTSAKHYRPTLAVRVNKKTNTVSEIPEHVLAMIQMKKRLRRMHYRKARKGVDSGLQDFIALTTKQIQACLKVL